jgi:hypothetical protein
MTNKPNIFQSKNVLQTSDVSRRSLVLRPYIAALLLLFFVSFVKGDVPVWIFITNSGKQYSAVAARIEGQFAVILKTTENKIERIPTSTLTPQCQKMVDELRSGKTFGSFDDNPLIAAKIPNISDDPVVQPQDAAKDGEFGVDVWGDVVEETARAEYQKQKNDYEPYLKHQKNTAAKKKEVEGAKNRYELLYRQYMKLPVSSNRWDKLSNQVDAARNKQWKLESELSELEYSRPIEWRIGKLPPEPDASLLQKKEKKIIGTVRAKLVRYADDGTVTYRIKEEEKKTHIREMTGGDMDRIIAERLKRPIDRVHKTLAGVYGCFHAYFHCSE